MSVLGEGVLHHDGEGTAEFVAATVGLVACVLMVQETKIKSKLGLGDNP